MPAHRLSVDWRRFLALVSVLIDQLIDADQRILDRNRTPLVHVDFAVMPREIFQRFSTAYYLDVGGGQAFLGMVLQHGLKLAYICHDFTTHPAPTHRLGFFGALTADMDDVVLDLLRTERGILAF